MTRTSSLTQAASWTMQYKDQQTMPYAQLGGASDEHLTAGANDASIWWYAAGMKFPFSFPGDMAKITSAVLYIRLTGGVHLSREGATPRLEMLHCLSAQPQAGGSVETSLNNVAAASRQSIGLPTLGGNSQGSTQSIDVMAWLKKIAPSNVAVGSLGNGEAAANHGLILEGLSLAANGRTEFWGAPDASGRGPYIVIGYELTNVAPNTPTITSPSNGATYVLGDRGISINDAGDTDGDPTTGYMEWGECSAYGATPGAWNSVGAGNSYTIPSASLTRGKWYAVRGRRQDHHGAWSGYSGTIWFYINQLPSNPAIA